MSCPRGLGVYSSDKMLHQKVILQDGVRAFVGSANLSNGSQWFRSFQLGYKGFNDCNVLLDAQSNPALQGVIDEIYAKITPTCDRFFHKNFFERPNF